MINVLYSFERGSELEYNITSYNFLKKSYGYFSTEITASVEFAAYAA